MSEDTPRSRTRAAVVNAAGRRWRARNKDKVRKLKGLPDPTRECPDKCECCGRRDATDLDHNHTTGKFRGWLCGPCNRGIGLLGDSVYGVDKASSYLRRNA